MRILLSTIGTRGDVQPLVALAMQLRALGQETHLCVPPDFRGWIEDLGLSMTAIGPELRALTAATPSAPLVRPSPEDARRLAEESVAIQFKTVAEAAQGCDLIVGATALQIAARSVAEHLDIGYVFTAICPAVFPSPHHAPPVLGSLGQSPATDAVHNRELWARDAASFNAMFGQVLNAHRVALGLAPVGNVRDHIFTGQPWLAADPVLAPWPGAPDLAVYQSGAWLLPDDRPLSAEIEAFLAAGDPPLYVGFGSLRAPAGLSQAMIEAARALGCRAIVSRGWADLALIDDRTDTLSIGEVNQQALFKRVAAVIHHGGAGTTTAAALAGAPQVVVPQMYDQHYFARRVQALGIGFAHAPGAPTATSLSDALRRTLTTATAERARAVADAMVRDGALVAAQRLVSTRPATRAP